jgi:hypothetical protein
MMSKISQLKFPKYRENVYILTEGILYEQEKSFGSDRNFVRISSP